jgi:hypothetical protein
VHTFLEQLGALPDDLYKRIARNMKHRKQIHTPLFVLNKQEVLTEDPDMAIRRTIADRAMAVDPPETVIREDAFDIKKHRNGWDLRVHIAGKKSDLETDRLDITSFIPVDSGLNRGL